MTPSSEPLWVFGYGSLMWRPELPAVEQQACFVRGYQRRFWQGSTDHRGVPGAPGRVVTLRPAPEARCWGIAYRVGEPDRAGVLAQLDHREKGGYVRLWEPVYRRADARPFAHALVYIASDDNPNYLGPGPLDAMVEQIATSHGPSGANVEYVLELASALRAIDAIDEHVSELERSLLDHLAQL